ncbi:hypothetical protein PENSPDRAFT_431993 [Peniophora sp. CONT]|nr:hypothetical protein PENSPDRAFT_431993 [Peniophora sp. CONT]
MPTVATGLRPLFLAQQSSSVTSHSRNPSTTTSITLQPDGIYTSLKGAERHPGTQAADSVGEVEEGWLSSSWPTSTLRTSRTTHVPSSKRNVLCVLFLLVAAGLVAALHHLYLAHFSGRPVGSTKLQYWIKGGSNAFAVLVQGLLVGSVSMALLDVTWFYLRRKSIALKHLDNVFSLPSLFYTARFLISPSSWSLHFVILLVICIQAFALIPVMTPNVLNTVSAPARIVNLTVPTVDMSQIPMDSSVTYWNSLSGPFYISPSTRITKLAQQTYTAAASLPWDAPSDCESSCKYSVQFKGPHLQCSDIDSTSIGDSEPFAPTQNAPTSAIYLPSWRQMTFDANTTFLTASELDLYGSLPLFNATSNMDVRAATSTDDVIITVAYLPARVYCSDGLDIIDNYHCSYVAEQPRGSVCRFHSATYHVDVQFADHTQTTSSRVVSIGDLLVFPSAELMAGGDPSYLASLSQLALADAFRLFIQGSIYGPVSRPLPPATINGTNVQYASLFSFAQPGPDGLAYTFAPSVKDVSQGLTDLFANMTLSLMSTSSGFGSTIRTTTPATILPSSSVWAYNRRRFAEVYVVAFVLALLCDFIGLGCLWSNGEPGSKAFSRIVAATRTLRLEQLAAADRREARRVKLNYGLVESEDGERRPGFGVVGVGRIDRIPSR